MPINCNQPNVYNAGNLGPLKRMNTILYVRHIFEHKVSRNIIVNSGRLATRRSKGAIRCRLSEWRRPIASAFMYYAAFQARDVTLVLA